MGTLCPENHYRKGKQLMNFVFHCNINRLFSFLFTNSDFYKKFQDSRNVDWNSDAEWETSDTDDGDLSIRVITGTTQTGEFIGLKESQFTEIQTYHPASRPGKMYAIDCHTVISDLPFANTFAINFHYCLQRISLTETNIKVFCKLDFKENTWARVLIWMYAMKRMKSYFRQLQKALTEECTKTFCEFVSTNPKYCEEEGSQLEIEVEKKNESPTSSTNTTHTNTIRIENDDAFLQIIIIVKVFLFTMIVMIVSFM